MRMIELLDSHNNVINVGDYITYATTSRIWVGTVTKLLEYPGDSETTYKIQIRVDEPDGTSPLRTFEHLGWKIFKIERYKTNGES